MAHGENTLPLEEKDAKPVVVVSEKLQVEDRQTAVLERISAQLDEMLLLLRAIVG